MYCMIALALALAAEPKTFEPGLTELQLESGAGDVNLRVVEGSDRISVIPTEKQFGRDCSLVYVTNGTTATVTMETTSKQARCEVRFDIEVPASVAANLTVGAGNVGLSKMKEPVRLDLGAGNVTLDVHDAEVNVGAGNVSGTGSGSLVIKAGTGNVELASLSQPVAVALGTGNVELTFSAAPSGRTSAKAGMGSIELKFPSGTTVHSVGKGGTFEVPLDAASKTVVDLATGMGRIRVR